MVNMSREKVDILAIGVHPDDIELSCSGTLLAHISMGKKVGLLDLTRGEMGTRGTIETRKEESENAKKLMGALFRDNAGMKDGLFQYGEENILKLVNLIRMSKPEIILCNAITDRHPDHGRASKLVSDAAYYSGLSKIESWDGENRQDAWRPTAVYHYIQDRHIEPDFVVDVSAHWKKKMELIKCFKTQFFAGNSEGPQTPISSKAFLEYVEAHDMLMGRHIGAKYGEGYTVERYLGVKNLFDLQ